PVDPPLFFGAGERGWHEDDRLVPVAVGGDRPPPAGTSAYLDFCVLRHKATLSHRCDTPQGPISLFGDGAVHFRAALGRAPAPLPLRCGPELVSRCARPPRAHRCPVTAGGRIRPPAAAAPAIRSGPPAEHRWNGGRTAGVQPVPGPSGRPRPFFPGTG